MNSINNRAELMISNISEYGEMLIFVDKRNRILVSTDKNYDTTNVLMQIPQDGDFADFIPFMVFVEKTTVYITSQNKLQICMYSMSNQELRLIKRDTSASGNVYNCFLYGGKIYMVPHILSEETYLFDVEKEEFEIFDWFGYEFEKGLRSLFPYIIEGCCAFPIYNSNNILFMNLEKKEIRKLNLGQEYRFCSAGLSKEGILLSQVNSSDLIWHSKGYIETVKTGVSLKKDDPFSKIYSYENSFIVLPRFSKQIIVVNPNRNINICDLEALDDNIERYDLYNSSLMYGCHMGDKCMILPWMLPYFVDVNISTGELCRKELLFSESDYYSKLYKPPFNESLDGQLEQFIKYIQCS